MSRHASDGVHPGDRWFGVLLPAAFLALLALLGGQLWISYQDKIRWAELGTRNIAAIFDARLDATLRRTDADLIAIAQSLPIEALDQKAVPQFAAAINAHLDERMFNLDEMSGYRIHDAQGDTLYSSDSASTVRVNVADRAYFKRVRDDPAAGLVISDVIVGKSTRQPVLVVVRALRDAAGNFRGIVHGMVNLDYYRNQFKALNLGASGIIALHRSDTHALVARFPEMLERINRPLPPDHPVVRAMADAPHDLSELRLQFKAPESDVSRVMGIRKMQHYPFYFAVAFGLDDVLAGWWSQASVVVGSTVLLFALVGLLLWRLARMRKREIGMLSTLAKSESQFRELAQMVPVGICHLDCDGRYTYVNDRYVEITGRTRGALIGKEWSSFIHVEDVQRIREGWTAAWQAGTAYVCEYRYEQPGGHVCYVQGEMQTDRYSAAGRSGYIAAVTDITRRKQAEAELLIAKHQAESANLAKTRFLAAASHDLRQPIQAINLFRDALSQTDLSEDQKTIAGFLSKSVRSLGDLLYSLLDVSKLDAGQVRPQLSRVKLEELFKAVDTEFSTLARQKNLRFKLYYPFKDVYLVTDPSLLMSVVRNLIDNALKYTRRGGVLVGFRRKGEFGVIQVWDTGIGIEPRYGEQIFEECFQVGNPVRDRTKGLGLGLSIARRMARLLGGEVSYRSRFGRGTVFEVILPLTVRSELGKVSATRETKAAPTGVEDVLRERIRGRRIVVVEDDPMVSKSIELSLATLGARVDVFGNAENALLSPDIVGADFYISDFSLPGLNGLQLLDRIQQRSATPIDAVLVTGETAPERIELTSAARWQVLFKPVELSRLAAVMTRSAAD